jgi:hypothetical protein
MNAINKDYIRDSIYHASWWLAERHPYPPEFERGVKAAIELQREAPGLKELSPAYCRKFRRIAGAA